MDIMYFQLKPKSKPPNLTISDPFRCVLIVDEEETSEWQYLISTWLVKSGCLYMMAWGTDCSSWDDSVDAANLEAFDFDDIPPKQFVMTTWHDNESLEDVFWFCKHTASHPSVELEATILVHISSVNKEEEILHIFKRA